MRKLNYLLILFTFFISTVSYAKTQQADKVFTNGKVYTVNKNLDWAEAVAVKDNKIIFVGSTKEAKKHIGTTTKTFDLNGKMMLPGFVETHQHMMAGSVLMAGLNLVDAHTYEDHVKILKEHKAAHPDEKVVIGFGYKAFPFKDGTKREILDEIFGEEVAVVLIEISGHAGWANTGALKQSGNLVNPEPLIPDFTYFEKDKKGMATGYIVETPQAMVLLKHFVDWDFDYIKSNTKNQSIISAEAGITAIFDAGMSGMLNNETEALGVYTSLAADNDLKQRIFASTYHNSLKQTPIKDLLRWQSSGLNDRSPYVEAKIFKMNIDGEPVQYTMKMLEPYSDRPGFYGTNIFEDEYVYTALRKAVEKNIDVHTHAMGDYGVRVYLDAIEKLKKEFPNSTTRFSLAHTTMIDDADFKRFAELDVTASFAGHWNAFTPDVKHLQKLMGDRVLRIYPAGRVIKAGGKICIGSDFVASGYLSTYEVLPQIEGLITRRQYDDDDAEQLPLAEDAITLEEALQAATINGAYMLHKEDQFGSIEVGKLADLIILDQNLFDIKPKQISDVKILLTMMDGKITYQDKKIK